MKVNLIYKGLYSGTFHKECIELENKKRIGDLKDKIEESFQSDFSGAPVNFCLSGDDDDVCNDDYIEILKYKNFTIYKITEIAQLVAIEEV
jgi:hypothetical protein